MAGGTFTIQDKVRPGAYINVKGVKKPKGNVGSRGIVTIPTKMEWGDNTELILIDSTKFFEEKHLKDLGYFSYEEEVQIIREALKNSYKLLLYRIDSGATKATMTLGTLKATAKHGGLVGNSISIVIKALENSKFEIVTIFRNKTVDTQVVSKIEDLVANDWVIFSGTGQLEANAGKSLDGATSGTVATENYTDYLAKIKIKKFDTIGVHTVDPLVKTKIVDFVNMLRDKKGKKVQAIINNHHDVDNEGVISNTQGYKTATETVDVEGFVGYMAGLTAGTDVNKSNTGHIIPGAIEIINYIDDDDIADALKQGRLVLSYTSDEKVQIEQDINTLVTFEGDKTKPFSKNRVIRCLDDIVNQTTLLWEGYKGKVDNEDGGRNALKADVLAYLKKLQELKAIKNVLPEDITVLEGEEIDAVTVEVNVQPIDSMEKLYMNVNVH